MPARPDSDEVEFDFGEICPPWCIHCAREQAHDAGFVVHQGREHVIAAALGAVSGPFPVNVRGSHLEYLPGAPKQPEPTDENRPLVDVQFPMELVDDILSFTPGQARALAAALVKVADELDSAQPAG